jgi:hypothetical protein
LDAAAIEALLSQSVLEGSSSNDTELSTSPSTHFLTDVLFSNETLTTDAHSSTNDTTKTNPFPA